MFTMFTYILVQCVSLLTSANMHSTQSIAEAEGTVGSNSGLHVNKNIGQIVAPEEKYKIKKIF